MKLSKLILLPALSLTASASQAAATLLPACSFSDLSGVTVTDFVGLHFNGSWLDGRYCPSSQVERFDSLIAGLDAL